VNKDSFSIKIKWINIKFYKLTVMFERKIIHEITVYICECVCVCSVEDGVKWIGMLRSMINLFGMTRVDRL